MANFPTIATGVPFFRAFDLIDPQAQAFYDRVIADGGVVPTGLIGVDATFKAVKAIYGVTDITQALSVFYDAHYLGYKSVISGGVGVTKGQAIEILYSACGASGDCVQTTLSNQPLLLAWSLTNGNYWFNPCIAGNSVTASSGVGYTFSTDTLILKAKVFLNNQGASGIFDTIGGQGTLYNLQITNVGTSKAIRILGTTASSASSSYTPSTTEPHWVRATLTPLGITFEWSADNSNWTSIGTSVLPNFGTSTTLTVGGTTGSTANVMSVYLFEVTNSTTSTTKVFNPNNYSASTSQTTFTSSGTVWTINTGTATTGYKGVLVDRTIVQSDGVDDTMQSGTITSRSNFTRYFAFNTIVASGTQYFIDGHISNRHLIYKGSSQLRLYNDGTGASEILNANTIGLKLITGDYNTSSSKLRTNAGADTNGTVGNATSTKVTLFSAGSGGSTSNITFTSLIDAIAIDNNTIKTAIYNLIRSVNNNAF